MIFNINTFTLADEILFKLKILKPAYYRVMDDPRIDTYYISLNQNNYIVLYGDRECSECDYICIYNNNNIKYNIMTTQGIENFVNNYDKQIDDINNIIFELKLNTFDGNMNDLILLLTNSIKQIVPF